MFDCERCGTRFNAGTATSPWFCPRCKSKDGVISPLSFRIFDPAAVAGGVESESPRAGAEAEGVEEG